MSIRKVYTTLNVRKAESQTTIEGLHVGDVGSTQLVISLMDGTRAIDLTKCGTVTAMIHGKKPDGYEIHNRCDVEGGKILYTLTAQDTAVSGTVYYQLDVQIDDGSGEERCFSPCFRTQVSERVYEPVFRLLDSEPEDWAQNYANYYKKEDDLYVKNDDPIYAADTFYELVDPPVDSASEFQAFWSAFHKVEGLFNQRLIIDRTTTDVGYDPDNVHKVFINATIQSGMKGVVFTAQDNKQYALCDDGLLRTRTYSGSYSEWKITSTFARYVETSVETPLSPNDCTALNTIYRVNIDSDGLVPTGVMPLINSVSSSGKRTQYALTNSGFIISRSRQSGGDFSAWSLVPPVDKQLSASSTNVVQNKVITAKFNEILDEIIAARGNYTNLKERIEHIHPTDEQVAEAVGDYLDDNKSVIVDKAIIENTEMLSPDVTFNIENDYVADYLSEDDYTFANDNAYSGGDYESTYIKDTIDSAVNERPNGGDITIPAGGVNITLYDTANKTKWSESITGDTYTVKNLIPNRIYTYTIKNSSGEIIKSGSCKASGQVRFIDAGKATTYPVSDPTQVYQRPLFNIRDLGGWACDGGHIKYGLVYRGCRLNGNYTNNQPERFGISLTPAQIDFFKNFLGIRDEIDFRQLKNDPDTGNTETAGDDAIYDTSDDIKDTALGIGVDYTIIPISPYLTGIEIKSSNTEMNRRYAKIIKRIARNIKEGKPCYMHCLEGADRTGTVAMLILALCGVSRNDIERDYELTSFSKDYVGNRNRRARNDTAQNYRWMNLMVYLLNHMTGATFRDKMIDYVLKIGVTIEEINTIRAGLIDGAPEKIKNPNSDVSVTYSLTNINTDNPISSIAMYQPFEATLTALNMKEIQSVTVLMGNTDITSTAYSQEKISIPRVTGNISITASASDVDIYSKPSGGIPKTDLSSSVQTSLGKADSALQAHQDISGKVDKVSGKGLSTNDYTTAEKNKLASLEPGNSIWKTTTAPTAPAAPAQPGYGFTLSTLTGPDRDVQLGDMILYSYYYYTVTEIIGSVAYAETRVSIRGSKGATGDSYNLTAQDKAEIAGMVDVTGKESTANKKASISNQSQTGDSDTNYPTVGAVRDFVNYVKGDLEDYIEDYVEEAIGGIENGSY